MIEGSDRTWFTADLHLGHRTVVDHGWRPFPTIEAHDRILVDNWNAVVGVDDTVWVLGDVCLGKTRETIQLCRALNGRKLLVPGNHDTCWPGHKRWRREVREYEAVGFEVQPILVHLPRDVCVTFGQQQVIACHFPYAGDHTDEDRFVGWRPPDDGGILLHGHIHNAWRTRGRQVNVGVDVWGFSPVSADRLATTLRVTGDAS